ncbi:MAG: ABC transporter permease [Rhodospirillaceae bacterium]|nr:ABC transporter permease [Rhodospirillaceae bacterium]
MADGAPLAVTPDRAPAESARFSLASAVQRREVWLSALALFAFLAGWEWGPPLLGIAPYNIPRLSAVFEEGVHMWVNGELLRHTLITCFEVIVGFGLGCLMGAVMGYVLGMSRLMEVVASPYILALQIAPKVAFAPLFVMWFGYNITPRILTAILIVFFPVLINVLTSVRSVDPSMIDLARLFKATRAQIFWKIEFPWSLPALFSGLRIGATLAVIGVTVAELVGGNVGLGAELAKAEGGANTAGVFVTIILLTVIGILAYVLVILAERAVLRYAPQRPAGGAAGDIAG